MVAKVPDNGLNITDLSAGVAAKAVSPEIISCASLAFVIIPSDISELVKAAAVGIFPI